MGFAALGFSVPVLSRLRADFLLRDNVRRLPVQGYIPIQTHLAVAEPPDHAGVRPRSCLRRADRPHHPHQHARSIRRRLYPHRAAKGAPTPSILLHHALKNAGVPIVTVIGIGVARLISGVVITETVFNVPGIGRLTVDAISNRDYPIIQGVMIVFSGVYVLINLGVDLIYTIIDPRIRYWDMAAVAAAASVTPRCGLRRFIRRNPYLLPASAVIAAMSFATLTPALRRRSAAHGPVRRLQPRPRNSGLAPTASAATSWL